MSEITRAIAARQTQIAQLQREIEALQRAASIVGPPAPAAAKPKTKRKQKRKRKQKPAAKPQSKQVRPKPKAKPKQTSKVRAKPKQQKKKKPTATQKQKRAAWSAADRAAISKRMKAYWAKRRKQRASR